MTDFDIKLPQMKNTNNLQQSRKRQKDKKDGQYKLARARRIARRRHRQRNWLFLAAVVCLAVAVLAVALNKGKPDLSPNGSQDIPSLSYNDSNNDQTKDDATSMETAQAETSVVPIEQQNAQAYVKALGKGEAIYAFADTSGRISRNKSATKKVALTFDDGPYDGKTEAYLKVLQQYKVPATFFCLGSYVKKNPDSAKAIVASGCELASHSWNHKNMPKQSKAIIAEDFRKTREAFLEAVGFAPYLFRAPYGATSDDLRLVAKEYGETMVFWSVDPADWKKPSVDKLINSAVNSARDGAIILLHENKTNTLEALPTIIASLQAKGYELVTVSQLLYENSTAQEADELKASAGLGTSNGSGAADGSSQGQTTDSGGKDV